MERPDYFDRFWTKVNIPYGDGCWEWNANKAKGYGKIKINGKMIAAHRLSYEYFYGVEVPKDMVVMHKCDNEPCVRPDHLEMGTIGDNTRDADQKGRRNHTFGIKDGNAKLTEEIVLDIRNKYASGQATQKELAAFYGLNKGHVWEVVHRYWWKHV